MAIVHKTLYSLLVGFGRACAPVRSAHPSFWAHGHSERGAARPPPARRSFAASYSTPKNIYIKSSSSSFIYSHNIKSFTCGPRVFQFFIYKYKIYRTWAAHVFADPSGNIFCTGAPKFFVFFFFQ
jgi:hypothetical protein